MHGHRSGNVATARGLADYKDALADKQIDRETGRPTSLRPQQSVLEIGG